MDNDYQTNYDDHDNDYDNNDDDHSLGNDKAGDALTANDSSIAEKRLKMPSLWQTLFIYLYVRSQDRFW